MVVCPVCLYYVDGLAICPECTSPVTVEGREPSNPAKDGLYRGWMEMSYSFVTHLVFADDFCLKAYNNTTNNKNNKFYL